MIYCKNIQFLHKCATCFSR